MTRQVGLRIAFVAAFLLTFGFEARAQNTNGSDSSEYLIKAGFIYNFAKLVEWPPYAWGAQGSPIVIAVLGNDSFAEVLDHVVDGKRIDGKPFVVKRLKWKDLRECSCQILFIASQESAHSDEIVQVMKNASVLTIAETAGFAKRGGIINFALHDSKVRFEVNVDAAKQAGLNISSRLLSLARIVQTNVTSR
jgi:hypothetical protein